MRRFLIWTVLSCPLLLVWCSPTPSPPLAQSTHIRGVVFGSAQAPLVGVRVTADEIGISRDTDAKGAFSLTVTPEIVKKGLVRLTFSLPKHQTKCLDIKLPQFGLLEVSLIPFYARNQPTLPPDFVSRLRIYRKEEIQKVHDFLGSKEKKLLSLEGIAGVGSENLVLVALQDAPRTIRRPIFWWDCEETDSLTLLAEEWAMAFRDPNLVNLIRRRNEVEESRDRRELDRETLERLLDHFERTPSTIVFNHFDRWLSTARNEIEEPALAALLSRAVNNSQAGKLLLISEEKPSLPRDLNPAWGEILIIKGFAPANALDFLRGYPGVKADDALLEEAALHLGGHPFALQLLAKSLAGEDAARQENRLRQFVQVGEGTFGSTLLSPLLERTHERLTPSEVDILNLLAVVRQPLTAGEIQEIGVGREAKFTREEVRQRAERLVRERFWVESFEDTVSGNVRFQLTEIVRPFLEDKLSGNRNWMTELHRRAYSWYRREYAPSEMSSASLPSSSVLARYDELVHQAFELADLTEGDEKTEAAITGSSVVIAGRDWHVLRDANRLLFSQLESARRLLKTQHGRVAEFLLAKCLLYLGDLYVRTSQLAAAERPYEEALHLFQAIHAPMDEANTLRSLGELYMRRDSLNDAEAQYKKALTIYRKLPGPLGEANTLRSIGDLYVRRDRLGEAENRYEEALPLYRKVKDHLGEARTLKSLGDLCIREARPDEAENRYLDALRLYRTVESRLGEAHTLRSLGDLYVQTTRIAEAERYYRNALRLYGQIEARLGKANTLRSLGDLYRWTDRLAESEKQYEEALRLYRQIEDHLGEAGTLRSLGDLYVQTDRFAKVEILFKKALQLYQEADSRLGEANTLRSLGDLYVRIDRLTESEKQYEGALRLYRQTGDRRDEAKTLRSFGDLYMWTNRLADSDKEYREALYLYREIGDGLGEAQTLLGLGVLRHAQNSANDAEGFFQSARRTYLRIDEKIRWVYCSQRLSYLCGTTSHPLNVSCETIASLDRVCSQAP